MSNHGSKFQESLFGGRIVLTTAALVSIQEYLYLSTIEIIMETVYMYIMSVYIGVVSPTGSPKNRCSTFVGY